MQRSQDEGVGPYSMYLGPEAALEGSGPGAPAERAQCRKSVSARMPSSALVRFFYGGGGGGFGSLVNPFNT